MRVLYIGNYKDGTGWGTAAQDYILALDSVGIDVVPRHIKLNNNNGEVPKRIVELEKKSSKGCDIVIQHVLPHFLDYCGDFKKNIALYLTETDNFRRSGWQDHINLMDEAWVTCQESVECSKNSGVTIPISAIPLPCDPSKYARRFEKIEFPELKDKFIFYFIGEITRRKNLVALLKAFHLEFETEEPVGLLIKASYPGLSPEDCSKKVVEMANQVKKELKKFRDIGLYKGEVVITQQLTNEQILQLHATCDCFVMPSFGEGWCIPAFDAMAMGKTPICTDQGGMSVFLSAPVKLKNALDEETTIYETAGWLVGYIEEPCFGMADSAVPQIYSGMENWKNISVNHLRRCMRQAYEDEGLRKKKAAFGIDRAYDFGYEEVGKIMDLRLHEIHYPKEKDTSVCQLFKRENCTS